MNRIAVSCSDLTKSYGQVFAVHRVNLELEEGKILALLGASGCGKTSLLRLIAGFEYPDSGIIEIAGRLVSKNGLFVPPENRRVGIVFQDHALFPHLNVSGNIAFGLPRGTDRIKRVKELLSLVGLKGFEQRMPHELSGGEQQRIALARALAPSPTILLLDEPFSNLDADLRIRIRVEVKNILTYAGTTAIFVTHDQQEALFIGDLVGVMNSGRIEQVAAPQEIFDRPATPFIAQFTGIADFLSGIVQDNMIITEIGNLPLSSEIPQGEKLKVMFRPNFFNIYPCSGGAGIVTDRIFQGSHFLYRIKLPSGASVRSLQDSRCYYPDNTRVAVQINVNNIKYFRENHKID